MDEFFHALCGGEWDHIDTRRHGCRMRVDVVDGGVLTDVMQQACRWIYGQGCAYDHEYVGH